MSQDSKNKVGNWKYTALTTDEINTELQTSTNSETSPLLQNMENEEIVRSGIVGGYESTQDHSETGVVKIHRGSHMTSNETTESSREKDKSRENNSENLMDKKMNNLSCDKKIKGEYAKKEENEMKEGAESCGARPKTKKTENAKKADGCDNSKDKDGNLDIVRKMSDLSLNDGFGWRCVGLYGTLKAKRCQRLYAKSGRADDLALFHINGQFYAMEAWCTHMGGPLFDGDIESYNGRCHVMCPWHSYMFDLETGNNEIGLKQQVYQMKYENGNVYIKYHSELSTQPESSRKVSRPTGPPEKRSEGGIRKTSILESPFQLT